MPIKLDKTPIPSDEIPSKSQKRRIKSDKTLTKLGKMVILPGNSLRLALAVNLLWKFIVTFWRRSISC